MAPDLRNEWWLAKRIFEKELCTLFRGVTDMPIRRTRMRAAIIERGMEDVMVGKNKPTTIAQAFERLYGEALLPRVAKVA